MVCSLPRKRPKRSKGPDGGACRVQGTGLPRRRPERSKGPDGGAPSVKGHRRPQALLVVTQARQTTACPSLTAAGCCVSRQRHRRHSRRRRSRRRRSHRRRSHRRRSRRRRSRHRRSRRRRSRSRRVAWHRPPWPQWLLSAHAIPRRHLRGHAACHRRRTRTRCRWRDGPPRHRRMAWRWWLSTVRSPPRACPRRRPPPYPPRLRRTSGRRLRCRR